MVFVQANLVAKDAVLRIVFGPHRESNGCLPDGVFGTVDGIRRGPQFVGDLHLFLGNALFRCERSFFELCFIPQAILACILDVPCNTLVLVRIGHRREIHARCRAEKRAQILLVTIITGFAKCRNESGNSGIRLIHAIFLLQALRHRFGFSINGCSLVRIRYLAHDDFAIFVFQHSSDLSRGPRTGKAKGLGSRHGLLIVLSLFNRILDSPADLGVLAHACIVQEGPGVRFRQSGFTRLGEIGTICCLEGVLQRFAVFFIDCKSLLAGVVF